jgi:alpha-tubulin suppressor-like RCC1 family protein
MRMRLVNVAALLFIICFSAAAVLPQTSEGAQRFEDNGDGTILDAKTGLVWLKDANIVTSRIPLQSAKDYIKQMNDGDQKNFGYDDWRAPTVKELMSLIDESRYYPALPAGHPFINVENQFYWTNSGGFNIIGYVWMVDLASGTAKYGYISYCNFLYLWPVRGTAENLSSIIKLPSPSELDLTISTFTCEEVARPPVSPAGLSVIAVSPSEVALSWDPVVDAVEIAWYNVYENETFVKSVPTAFASISDIEPGAAKCYRISAFNAAGIESKLSNKVCTETWTKPAKGTVWSVGSNQYGQLGDGTNSDSETLVRASGLSDVVKVSAGVEHVIALKSDGTVWTWGRNLRGQLGDGSLNNSFKPIQVKGLENVVDVDAGWYHSLALKSDGTVWAWGRNYYGQLGNGERADKITPVRVRNLSKISAISAGWYHSLALGANGNVWAWGWNLKGQLGNDSYEGSYVPTTVTGLRDIIKVSAGMYHSLALKSDGTVWAWGWNEYGQLGVGNNVDSVLPVMTKDLSDITDISGGMHHSVVLRSDGKVMAWGRNEYGQLGVMDVAQSSSPVLMGSVEGIQAVSAGAHHSASLDNDGTVWTWGWNYGSKQRKSPPRHLGGITGINMVEAGMNFTILLKEK